MNNKEFQDETEAQQSKNAELLPSAPLVASPLLPAVYRLVILLGCCFILSANFYMEIKHQQRVDKIFEDYYKKMSVLNGR